jgi:menaquinone-dependent protoporphyrinogen oxidase
MKSIIIYESKTGTAEKCAYLIAENNNIKDIYKASSKPNLNGYDDIILVSPIYMGSVNKKIKEIISANPIPMRLVLVGTNTETYSETIEHNFNEETRKRLDIIHVGGAYNFEKLNFLQRFIIKKMTGITTSTDLLDYKKLNTITC